MVSAETFNDLNQSNPIVNELSYNLFDFLSKADD